MKKLFILLLLLTTSTQAKVQIRNSDVADNTFTESKMRFVPVVSTDTEQAGVTLYVTSGTISGPLTVGSLISDNLKITADKHITAFTNTLGVGTPFYSFITDYDITISTMALSIQIPGSPGTTTWKCSDGGAAVLHLISTSSDAAGALLTNYAPVDIAKHSTVKCLIESSTQINTPVGIIELIYNSRI